MGVGVGVGDGMGCVRDTDTKATKPQNAHYAPDTRDGIPIRMEQANNTRFGSDNGWDSESSSEYSVHP